MRIFLDIGAYPSWTMDCALLPEFKMDQVVGFDPSPEHHPLLRDLYGDDPRVKIVQSGLWNKTCQTTFYNEGSIGGSVFKDFRAAFPNGRNVECDFIDASDWFATNVQHGHFVVVKLNCEGSECDILDRLMDTGEYKKITIALVDFDVRKSPSQKHRQAEILSRAKQLQFTGLKIWPGGRNKKRQMICNTLSLFKD